MAAALNPIPIHVTINITEVTYDEVSVDELHTIMPDLDTGGWGHDSPDHSTW